MEKGKGMKEMTRNEGGKQKEMKRDEREIKKELLLQVSKYV